MGIEVDGQTPARYEALKETLPCAQFLDRSNLIRLLRMVKSHGHRTATINSEILLSCHSWHDFRRLNPTTATAYEVPEQTHITLNIYNQLGQEVVRLVDQVQAAGRYEAVWRGAKRPRVLTRLSG